MPQLDYVESWSRPGEAVVAVSIRDQYWADRLPQVWDEMRRKIRDVESELPPGAARPVINDEFGDVFGFQLAVVGDGFNYAELERYAKILDLEPEEFKGEHNQAVVSYVGPVEGCAESLKKRTVDLGINEIVILIETIDKNTYKRTMDGLRTFARHVMPTLKSY